jgi:hypothetical protein
MSGSYILSRMVDLSYLRSLKILNVSYHPPTYSESAKTILGFYVAAFYPPVNLVHISATQLTHNILDLVFNLTEKSFRLGLGSLEVGGVCRDISLGLIQEYTFRNLAGYSLLCQIPATSFPST